MRRVTIVPAVCVTGMLAASATAQVARSTPPRQPVAKPAAPRAHLPEKPLPPEMTEAAYSQLMKSINTTAESLKRSVDDRIAPDAFDAGLRLETLFKQVEAFWTRRRVEDAIKFARAAQMAASDTGFAAKSAFTSGAVMNFQKLAGTCKSCHDAHREKLPDGSSKIK